MNPTTRRPIIAGNWKMNKTVAEAKAFVSAFQTVGANHHTALANLTLVIFPSFLAIQPMQTAAQQAGSPLLVGAQTMESRDSGAYTGEISPTMLQDAGVQWVILGHSERRQYFNETDTTVGEKAVAALNHQLAPIVCVGETIDQRQAGQADAVITTQVQAAIAQVPADQRNKLVFAYEPVWAIGTGETCDAAEANRVCGLIRQIVGEASVPVLYGGSVKPANAKELFDQPDIDGALIGGASLKAEDYWAITEAALNVTATCPTG